MTDFLPPPFLRDIQKSPIRQISDRAKPGDISLGLGEPDLPTPDVIRNAAIKVIAEEQNGYTLQAGLPALRDRVAADYPQMNLTADQVIITAGSQEALYLALMTLVNSGDEVLIPDPGFVAYPTLVRMAGGIPVTYRMPASENFSFDEDAFKNALTERTKVVVCVSPSNPTGRTLSGPNLTAIAAALKGTGVYLLSDEIYRDIYFTGKPPPTASSYYDQTIVISGLSKSMSMTGWRLGWICGDAAVIRAALVLHGYVTTCASTVSQKAALAAWSVEGEAARAEIRQTFHQRRDYLVDLIRRELGLNAVVPDGAFYTMVNVSDYGSSLTVADRLLENGVVTVPGSAFGTEGEGFLRISFCADASKLAEGVARMRKAFATHAGAVSK
ncbi:MAG TPA: aminotransferase class I/II-fold pyridoxal phosphate-dependent enzyme [Pyrinomonadaceae bacterium]|nr:aminotransferase class I/II-fold pyridoxal phosphate-dependent enzyme [Pyrinomonadaceae bacterium]